MTNSIVRRAPRWRLLVGVALTALLALTGCASTDEGASGSGDGAQSGLLPSAEGTTKYPLKLTTWAGETTLEQRPERVAVIGMNPNMDALQALDVVPVYTLTEDTYQWRDKAWWDKIETVDSTTRKDPINFEGIAAAKPDLIIALGAIIEKPEFTKLADIAPVLDTEKEGADLSWQDLQRLVGDTLDLGAAAAKVVTSAEQEIAKLSEAHPEFDGKTITIANDYGAQHGLSYYTIADSVTERAMTDLGFTPNPHAKKFVEEDVVPDENQGLLDGDVLVVVYNGKSVREEREAKALFAALPPVQDDRYVALTLVEEEPTKLTNAAGEQVENATWVLRRGASAVSLPWGLKVVADQWLDGAKLS